MALKFYHILILNVILLLLNSFTCLSLQAPLHAQNLLSLNHFQNLVGAQKGQHANGISELKVYLFKLGYMEKYNITMNPDQAENQNLFDEHLESALKKYQKFFRLNSSGILDSQTVTNLGHPRCGMPDHYSGQIMKPNFSFFPGNPKWNKRSLTYSFAPNTRKDVMRPIRKATFKWSSVMDRHITFRYIPDYAKADIRISFETYNHGDDQAFDGPGGILAHSYAPMDGRLHYDGSENWVDGVVPGRFDLLTVGLHELGHVLGLAHSESPSSIMWPTIGSGYRKDLSQDDRMGIDLLYGITKKYSHAENK